MDTLWSKVVRVATVLFYAGLACFFFGFAVPYLELILGFCALILFINSL